VLTGRSVTELAELADRAECPDGPESSDEPEFEQWRQRIRRELAVPSSARHRV
jgi:hypothetical protein